MRDDRAAELPDPWTVPYVSIARAGTLLHLSRSAAYRAAGAGEIPTVRLGGRRVVASADVWRLRRLPIPARSVRPEIY